MSLHDFIREMPKVELHVHLEGSIRPSTLLALARRNGVDLPADDLAGLRKFYRFTDFAHFIQVYRAISSCLQTVGDFALIAHEFGADLARQNIRYAEVTFTPYPNVARTGLPFDEMLAGPMFNTDLVREYQVLADRLGFTAADLERLSLNAWRASFLPASQKAALEVAFLSEFTRLRMEHQR